MRMLRFVGSAGAAGFQLSFHRPDRLGGSRDLSVASLRAAYAKGLCLSSVGARQTWDAPEERMVLFIENFHIDPCVRRRLRRKEFSVTFDQDFATVVRTCAEAGGHRVSSRVIEALAAAYNAGLAHSIEIRDRSGALVGGIFGLAIGKVFFTESHFALARDAAKVGFTALNCHLQRWGFLLNDGKHVTGRQCQLGYLPVTRESFNALLAVACTRGGQEGRWTLDQSLNLAGWNPRAMSTLH